MATWTVETVVRVIDGDSIVATISRVLDDDGARQLIERRPLEQLRLVTVDTPERRDPVAYAAATADTVAWLGAYQGLLEVEDYGREAFGRLLADLYPRGLRGDTLSQHLLRIGWLPYVKG